MQGGSRRQPRSTSQAPPRSSLIAYAIPGFLFAILLVILFAGGSYRAVVPVPRAGERRARKPGAWPARIAGLCSGTWCCRPWPWLPGGSPGLTVLTKNCFLEEIRKQYVHYRPRQGGRRTAGSVWPRVPECHAVDRGRVPGSAFIGILFSAAPCWWRSSSRWTAWACSGSRAAIRRDYPVMFGTLYIFTILGLLMQIVGDLLYTIVDPRIDFEARQ